MRLRYLVLLLAIFAVSPACIPVDTTQDIYLSCTDGKVDAFGNCILSIDNNAGVFGAVLPGTVISGDVDYANGTKGFIARPSSEGVYPAVVVIHEWWGLNDNIRSMAEALASRGYVVLAVDLYGGRVAENSSDAGAYAAEVRENPKPAIENMRSAVAYLKGLDSVDSSKLASLGWCFGGGQSLELALSGENMSATVIYYGSLTDDKYDLEVISWPVLGIFGAEDTSIPVDSVESFKQSLDELGITNEIYIYPGVGHAFANPSGARFALNETKDAWNKTISFLDRHLKE